MDDVEAAYVTYEQSQEDMRYENTFRDIMKYAKSQYTDIVLRVIEAIEFKAMGYTGCEIAQLYGVKLNLVNAWISKARKNSGMIRLSWNN